MRADRDRIGLAVGLLCLALGACRDSPEHATPPPDAGTREDASPPRDLGADAGTLEDAEPDAHASDADTSDAGGEGSEPVLVGAWNLHNFSTYGPSEFRIDAIATQIASLGTDVLGIEEIKVQDGTEGVGPQAWDSLLERLPDFEGVHNPYDSFDTTVGLIVRRETTTIVDWETILTDDRNAFPRPPLHATVRVVRGDTDVTFGIIVVHLKAFADFVDRRRSACTMLRAFIEAQPDDHFVLVGDWNDDPYDPPAENSFVGTFLDAEPNYVFLTASLPPESVSSLGYYHDVGGTRVTGEFLDHAIATGALVDRFARVIPSIVSRPEAELAALESSYSDHFPIVVRFEP